MQASFSIDIDVPRSVVRITMAGFFTAEDILRFIAERDEAFLKLRCAPNQHVTVVDFRKMDIQPQDSVAGFRRLMSNPATTSRRLAIVVPHSLARMQIERAAIGRGARFFTTMNEAEHWVLEREPSTLQSA